MYKIPFTIGTCIRRPGKRSPYRPPILLFSGPAGQVLGILSQVSEIFGIFTSEEAGQVQAGLEGGSGRGLGNWWIGILAGTGGLFWDDQVIRSPVEKYARIGLRFPSFPDQPARFYKN